MKLNCSGAPNGRTRVKIEKKTRSADVSVFREGGMHQERSNYPKFQIHEKTLSTSEVVCRPGKLSGTRERDQSLFSLLLEIESRLRTEDRNDQIEQLKRSKEKDRQRSRVNNPSRCE